MRISNTYDVLKDVWFSISCQRKSISYCSIDRLDGDIWFRYISLDIPTLHPHTTLKISLDKIKHLKMRDLPFRMNTFYLPFLFFFFFAYLHYIMANHISEATKLHLLHTYAYIKLCMPYW